MRFLAFLLFASALPAFAQGPENPSEPGLFPTDRESSVVVIHGKKVPRVQATQGPDVTGLDPHMTHGAGVVQALWDLRYNQTAKRIQFLDPDVIDFGTSSPKTVDGALRYLAHRDVPAAKVKLAHLDVINWGLTRPTNGEEAMAILVQRIHDLEARVSALEH